MNEQQLFSQMRTVNHLFQGQLDSRVPAGSLKTGERNAARNQSYDDGLSANHPIHSQKSS
jgi:hypothetical protein